MKRLISLFSIGALFAITSTRAGEEFEKTSVDGENHGLMKKCMEGQMESQKRFQKGYSGYNSGPTGWVSMYYQQLSDRILHQVPNQVRMTLCMLEAAFGWDGSTVPYSATRTMEMRGMGGAGSGGMQGSSQSFTIYSKMSVAAATADEKGSVFDASEEVRTVKAWFGPSQAAVTADKPKVMLIYSGKGTQSRGIGVFNNDGTMNGQGEGRFLQTQTIRWDRKADDGVQSVAIQEAMQSTPGQAFASKEGNTYAPTGGDRNFQALANYYPANFTDSKGTEHKAGELEVSVNERSSFGGTFMTMSATAIMNKTTGEGNLCMSGQSGHSGSTYSRPSNCYKVTIDPSTGDISKVDSALSSTEAGSKFDNRKVFKSDYNPSPNSMSSMHQGTQYSGSNGAGNTETFKPSHAGGAFSAQKFRD